MVIVSYPTSAPGISYCVEVQWSGGGSGQVAHQTFDLWVHEAALSPGFCYCFRSTTSIPRSILLVYQLVLASFFTIHCFVVFVFGLIFQEGTVCANFSIVSVNTVQHWKHSCVIHSEPK